MCSNFFILIIGVVAVLFIFGKIPSGKTPTNSNLTNDQVKKDINSYLGADATKTWYYGTDQTKITFTLKATPTQDKSGKWQANLGPSVKKDGEKDITLSLNWTTKANDKDITTQIGNQKYSKTKVIPESTIIPAIPKPPTNNLTAKDVDNDINNYLKADTKPWYYNTDQTKITFTLKATPIQDKSGKWQAILDPSQNKNGDPEVNLSLKWKTKNDIKDSDITTQIGNQKYSKTKVIPESTIIPAIPKPPTNNLTDKDVANDINNYLKGKTWYLNSDTAKKTPITFTLSGKVVWSSTYWTGTLDPSSGKKDVDLELKWKTKNDIKDSDIETQIGKDYVPPKSSNNLKLLVINLNNLNILNT